MNATEKDSDRHVPTRKKQKQAYDSHKYDEALQAFDMSIAIKPGYEENFAWFEKGETLCKQGKYEEALKI